MNVSELTMYVENAIQRLSAASTKGSHAAGIFNKAANAFEKRFAAFVESVTSKPNLEKLTLGQLIHTLENLPAAEAEPFRKIIVDAKGVNDPWKKVKHGNNPPVGDLLLGLRKILDVIRALP